MESQFSGSPTLASREATTAPEELDHPPAVELSTWVPVEPQARSLEEEEEEHQHHRPSETDDETSGAVILEESTTATTVSDGHGGHQHSYTPDGLILLLQQVRSQQAHPLHQIVLDRSGGARSLPAAYLRALLSALVEHPHVQRVRLVHQTQFNDACANLWAELIRTNNVVTDWHLTKAVTLTNGHAIALALRESTVCRLRRLVLEGSGLTDEGLAALIEAVAYRPTLQIFKIGKHADAWGPAAQTALHGLLQRPDCPLRKLDLRRCCLGDAAIAALAREALVVNTSLRSLCVGGNHLNDAGVRSIAQALRHNAHLQTLDLQYNLFTDTGLAVLAGTLQWHNDTLLKIKLRHCPAVSEPMKQHLLDLLLVHAHGPELAQQTKLALESLWLLLDEGQEQQMYGSNDKTSPWNTDDLSHTLLPTRDDSHSSSYDDDDDNDSNARAGAIVEDKDQDGGWEGVLREAKSPRHAMDPQPKCKLHPPKQLQPRTLQLTDCVICFDKPATVALLPCLHRNCCQLCAARLKTCHMCRATIVKVFPLLRHYRRRDDSFFSNMERYRAVRQSHHELSSRPSPCLDDGGDNDNDNDNEAGDNSDDDNTHNSATVDCTNNS